MAISRLKVRSLLSLQLLFIVTIIVLVWDLQQFKVIFHSIGLDLTSDSVYELHDYTESQIIKLDVNRFLFLLVISIVPRLVCLKLGQFTYHLLIIDFVLLLNGILRYIILSAIFGITLTAVLFSIAVPYHGIFGGYITGLDYFTLASNRIAVLLFLIVLISAVGWHFSQNVENWKIKLFLNFILLLYSIFLLYIILNIIGLYIVLPSLVGFSKLNLTFIRIFTIGSMIVIGWLFYYLLSNNYELIIQNIKQQFTTGDTYPDKQKNDSGLLRSTYGFLMKTGTKQVLFVLILFIIIFSTYPLYLSNNELTGSVDLFNYLLVFVVPIIVVLILSSIKFDDKINKLWFALLLFLFIVMIISSLILIPVITQTSNNLSTNNHLFFKDQFSGNKINTTSIDGNYSIIRQLPFVDSDDYASYHISFQSIAIVTIVNQKIIIDTCVNISSIVIDYEDVSIEYGSDKINIEIISNSNSNIEFPIVLHINDTIPDLQNNQYYTLAIQKNNECSLVAVPSIVTLT